MYSLVGWQVFCEFSTLCGTLSSPVKRVKAPNLNAVQPVPFERRVTCGSSS